ncbi:MAG: hypothetical protein JWQ33_482 [Ramlibacter sp.]|nr:hypothetical protein [Ramlibacter sp.]
MNHLANDPNASRMGYRPVQNESKGRSFDHPRSRGGHAWPFLSRYAGRPAPQNASKNSSSDSGS